MSKNMRVGADFCPDLLHFVNYGCSPRGGVSMANILRFLSVLGVLLMTAAPAFAAVTRPNAAQRYWRDFKEFWGGAFANQSAVVMITLGFGAIAMFIITRGKWKK
jgi:hypothetical protein